MSLRAEVAKNNIIFTAGNIGSAFLSFVFSIVVARMLQPEQFGLFSFALVVSGFFMIFVDLGISSTLVKFMSGYLERGEKSRAGSLIIFLLKFRVGMALIVGGFMLAFPGWISSFVFNKPEGWVFVMFAAGLLLSNIILDFMNSVLLGLKKFRHMVIIRLSERIMKIVLAPLLILSGMAAFGAVSGVIASFFIASLIGFIFLRKHGDITGSKGPGFEKRKILRFGFWAFIGSFISSLYMMIDALLVSMLMGVEEIGFYSIGVSWMNLIAYVVPISSIVMYPYFSSLNKEKVFEALQNSIKYTLITALPLSFLMSAFSADIINIFYGQSFMPAASALSLLSFVGVTLVLSSIIMGCFYGLGKPKLHSVVMIFVFAASLLLVYHMTNVFGIWGAAAGILISRIIEVSVLLGIIAISLKKGLRWDNVLKSAIASIAIYIIASRLTADSLAEVVLYGFSLLGVYLAIMLAVKGIERNELKSALQWLRSFFGL